MDLNSDVTADEARALHRVVRAIHDGNCPKCGHLAPAEVFQGYLDVQVDENGNDLATIRAHKCPACGFEISAEEASLALAAFRPYMEANVRIFEQWRDRLNNVATDRLQSEDG